MLFKKQLLCIIIALAALHMVPVMSLHVLHLSFHKGCINEINFIAQQLGFTVTSLFIPDILAQEWDGYAQGNALYNVGYERARCVWQKHKDYFNQFDAIITSDTAPLSRIFLQNNYEKPLIIWICNRFDYVDNGSLDCEFPDEHYYQLLRQASTKKNVYLVPYTAFESFYAMQKNVTCDDMVIKPTGFCVHQNVSSAIAADVVKENMFFIPPYHNDATVNSVYCCGLINIPVYHGRYNGPHDLKAFKGIIHIPYAWSNVAFFENIQQGLPYFVPSASFMLDMHRTGMLWWQNNNFFKNHYQLSEWYNPENAEVITYFDSWQDLKHKIETIDFAALRLKVKNFAQDHINAMLDKWRCIFDEIVKNTKEC